MYQLIYTQLMQSLHQTYRNSGSWLTPLIFYSIFVSLFPLTLRIYSPQLLSSLAAGIIWIGVLLANLLSLDQLFKTDFQQGNIDLWLLSPYPLPLFVVTNIASHWICYGVPLLLLSPLLGMSLQLSWHSIQLLTFSLLLGTPIFSLIGAIGCALTLNTQRQNMVLPILIIPLYIPVLIFGSQIVNHAKAGLAVNGNIAMLGALLLITLAIAPLATSAALRIGGQY